LVVLLASKYHVLQHSICDTAVKDIVDYSVGVLPVPYCSFPTLLYRILFFCRHNCGDGGVFWEQQFPRRF